MAVTRQGYKPALVVFGQRQGTQLLGGIEEKVSIELVIAGPPDALQMSGPVMDAQGRIAVAVNIAGNWDIWIFDDHWYRLTDAPSVEIDPWWIGDKLVFASNITGRFQIHGSDFKPLTHASAAALLPRSEAYLYLDASGFRRQRIDPGQIPALAKNLTATPISPTKAARPNENARDYSAWKSLWPNHIEPDYFFNIDNFQLGLSTKASDVSRNYSWNAGVRYEPDDEEVSWRLGYHAKSVSSRMTRYPFSSSPQKGVTVDEMRLEVNLSWTPETVKELSLAANWQRFSPDDSSSADGDIWWASIGWKKTVGTVHTALKADIFNDGSQSLYGDLFYRCGEKINTILRLQGGKSWGDVNPGRNTFRIGGNTGEGSFTQRSSRLFPVRGFDSGIIDDEEAISVNIAVLWPFAKLQTGYKTLPLFLHNITLGTFIDAGYAGNHFYLDDILVSAGVELITGIQMAWESKSHLSIGLAWPLKTPDDIQQDGPTFLILIGRPL